MTTGIRDLDLKILSELDDLSLLNFCKTSKYGKKLCDNETFWYNRTNNKYGNLTQLKNPNRSWKNLYLKLTYYLDKYTDDKTLEELAKGGIKNLDLIKIIINMGKLNRGIMRGLEEAAKIGDYRLTKFLLEEETKNKPDKSFVYHWSILRSIESGNMELFHYLLKKNNYVFLNIDVALQYAAKTNNRYLVDYLISLGADDWNRGLYGAAEGGHMGLVQFFIDKGADGYNFAMYNAAEGGHMQIINLMIQKGAKYWNGGMDGAAEGGHMDLVNYFIDKGADDWNRALISAAEGGHKDIVQFLLNKGADNVNGALEAASHDEKNKELIDILIQKGANNFDEALINAKHGGYKSLINFFEEKVKNL